ncbi:LLM class flavin-dependent oxidoreductase [Ancylobacter defluvii]|uniref:Monooxygenase n=1 Tax=Ancylobacter defluvii TaxID=1282440 RepID=A0A9W6JYU7_9HYPH|nr:LLM class flavin-dependent oxidoreductase [Ancylobacter defluvii]MBS7588623.1 LLM class flavin-dependent oxidoreductase [Ancylobacter defluvii]GLK83903.1 monooxygenase [Ancylobacter defluvii]
MSQRRQLSLNFFVYPGGHHEAAWRYKGTDISRLNDIAYYQDLAKRAEAATIDSLFFADGPVLADNIRYAARYRVEPITWLAAIGAVTSHIGLIATASTTYNEPYNLARLFASLDHLSGGRAGWNIVTTSQAAASQNFGLAEHPVHAERYERSREFVEVVTKLWDSWEDEAVVADQASGLFADTARIHPIEHVGKHFRVKGALNAPRTPQGRPVYVQAGSSEDGRSFAAHYAEAIFTAHQTLGSAQAFYADIKARASALGRRPEHIKVLPGLSPFIGSTEAEAKALEDEFNELIQPEYSLHQLLRMTGIDLSGYDLDGPFPRHLLDIDGTIGAASRFQLIVGILDRENPTIRQLINRLAGGRGHFVLAGTPERIADEIQQWFENGAADGFNIMPPWLTGGFDAFADEVVPLLRRRSLFRTEYRGRTLRDHYGLPRPDSRFAGDHLRASA